MPAAERRDRLRWSRHSWEELAADADKSVAKLQQFGIRVNEASRFMSYRRILKAIAEHDRSATQSATEISLAHQAVFEVQELVRILDAIDRTANQASWLIKLEIAVNGPPLIEDERRTSIARDTQFELCVASLATAGGLDVQLSEPDILLGRGPSEAGIAAKRVTSQSQLRKRIKQAAAQVARTEKPGFICLDLSLITHPREGFLQVGIPAQASTKVKADADSLCFECRRELLRMHSRIRRYVIAVLVHVACIYRRADSTAFGIAQRWSIGTLLTSEDPRNAVLTQLYHGLEAGLTS